MLRCRVPAFLPVGPGSNDGRRLDRRPRLAAERIMVRGGDQVTRPVLVIGAGWSGAAVARKLTDAGMPVEVCERSDVVGGHSRVETLGGVMYEPNGPHLLHTND